MGRFVEEAASGADGAPDGVRVGVVETLDIPSAVTGELPDRVASGRDELPQILRARHAAGEPTPHPDDRHRLATPLLGVAHGLPGPAQVGHDAVEVVPP